MGEVLSIVSMLAPDLSLIVLGGLIRALLQPAIWAGLDRLNFLVLFPALLFVSTSACHLTPGDVGAASLAIWLIIAVGFFLAWGLRPWGPTRYVDFAGTWQTAYRFNAALGFVAVTALPPAAAGMMAIAVGVAVPLANLLAVGALSRGTSKGPWSVLQAVATNPFLLASVAGVATGLSGQSLPDAADTAIDRLAGAAVPLALLSVGASMDWRAALQLDRFTGALVGIKLVGLPMAALAVVPVLSTDPTMVAVALVFAALPTASAAHVLAGAFGADRRLTSNLVAQSTLIGCVTLPIWIMLSLRFV